MATPRLLTRTETYVNGTEPAPGRRPSLSSPFVLRVAALRVACQRAPPGAAPNSARPAGTYRRSVAKRLTQNLMYRVASSLGTGVRRQGSAHQSVTTETRAALCRGL